MVKEAPNTSVKCALSSLGCARNLREAIDELATRVHRITVRGTHLANSIIAEIASAKPSGEALENIPDIFKASWWQQCCKASARAKATGNLANCSLHCKAQKLFHDLGVIHLGGSAKHALETFSNDIIVNINVMLILNFHKQLRKAFRREILAWCATSIPQQPDFEPKIREAIVDYCIFTCVQQGSQFQIQEYPSEAPQPLLQRLNTRIDFWRNRYADILPCPMPQWISNFKAPQMQKVFCWSLDLQRQRRDIFTELGGDTTANALMQKAGKAMRALPLTKFRVGHIAVDRTLLKCLLLEMQKAGHDISDLEIPLFTEVIVKRGEDGEPLQKKAKQNEDGTSKQTRNRRNGDDDSLQTEIYWSHFPGARRFQKQKKGSVLYPFIRTDGISCTVSLITPGKSPVKAELKALKKLENACDLKAVNIPLQCQPGQRLVAIDPGRRDMVYCTAEDDIPGERRFAEGYRNMVYCAAEIAENAGIKQESFKVSTRQHVRQAKRHRIAKVTTNLQKSTFLKASAYICEDLHADLHTALCHLPSSKAFETYTQYEDKILPILEETLSAMAARRLRREALLSYMSKDKALDNICSKICDGIVSDGTMPQVLVAFGNGGKVSTTGCGYAPAPQGRLRHRLQKVWGARVSLINEYHTSQKCASCHSQLEPIYKSRNKGITLAKKVKIHGVLCCRQHDEYPLYMHRDLNATLNIMAIYKSLATDGLRPEYLRPQIGSRFA